MKYLSKIPLSFPYPILSYPVRIRNIHPPAPPLRNTPLTNAMHNSTSRFPPFIKRISRPVFSSYHIIPTWPLTRQYVHNGTIQYRNTVRSRFPPLHQPIQLLQPTNATPPAPLSIHGVHLSHSRFPSRISLLLRRNNRTGRVWTLKEKFTLHRTAVGFTA